MIIKRDKDIIRQHSGIRLPLLFSMPLFVFIGFLPLINESNLNFYTIFFIVLVLGIGLIAVLSLDGLKAIDEQKLDLQSKGIVFYDGEEKKVMPWYGIVKIELKKTSDGKNCDIKLRFQNKEYFFSGFENELKAAKIIEKYACRNKIIHKKSILPWRKPLFVVCFFCFFMLIIATIMFVCNIFGVYKIVRPILLSIFAVAYFIERKI